MSTDELENERRKLLRTLERILDVPLMLLGLLWLVILIIELTHGLNKTLERISISIWIIFIADFLIKLTIASNKRLYLRKNILTILSLVVPALRLARLLMFARFIRTLRLAKVLGTVNRSMRLLSKLLRSRGLGYVLILTIVIDLIGAAALFNFENSSMPGSYAEALYFSTMFILTIGSEFWPVTPEGRITTFFLSLYGFSILGYITASLASFFIGKDSATRERVEKQSDRK